MIVTISREETEVEVEVEYNVTSRGYPARRGRLPEDDDPGEGPEWDLVNVWYLDEEGKITVSAMKDLTDKEIDYINESIREELSFGSASEDYDYDPCAEDPPDDDICDQYYDPY